MRKCVALIIFSLTALAADNWERVAELKAGSDIRIVKKNGLGPIPAQFVSLTETKLVVVIRKKETSIERADVERVDYHPSSEKPVASKNIEGGEDSLSVTFSRATTRDAWRNVYQR